MAERSEATCPERLPLVQIPRDAARLSTFANAARLLTPGESISFRRCVLSANISVLGLRSHSDDATWRTLL